MKNSDIELQNGKITIQISKEDLLLLTLIVGESPSNLLNNLDEEDYNEEALEYIDYKNVDIGDIFTELCNTTKDVLGFDTIK